MVSPTTKFVRKCGNNSNLVQPGLTRNLLPHSVNVSPKPSARTTKLSTGSTPNRQGPKLSPEPRCNLQRFRDQPKSLTGTSRNQPEISPNLIWAETPKLTLLGTYYSLTIAATQAKPKCSHAQPIPTPIPKKKRQQNKKKAPFQHLTLLQPGNPWVPARSASEKS